MLIRTVFGAAILLGGVYLASGLTRAVTPGEPGAAQAAESEAVAYQGPPRSDSECERVIRRLVDESFDGSEDTPDSGPAAILQLSKTVGKLATVKAKARAAGCDMDRSRSPYASMRDSDGMTWEERMRRNDQNVRFDPGKPMTRPTAMRPNPSYYR